MGALWSTRQLQLRGTTKQVMRRSLLRLDRRLQRPASQGLGRAKQDGGHDSERDDFELADDGNTIGFGCGGALSRKADVKICAMALTSPMTVA